jgi:hypothetical protein
MRSSSRLGSGYRQGYCISGVARALRRLMLMALTVISGTANLSLGEGIATQLGVPLGRRVVQRFPGDELHIKNELRIVR